MDGDRPRQLANRNCYAFVCLLSISSDFFCISVKYHIHFTVPVVKY